MQGTTPDSLLALHDAGYQEVLSRLGAGLVLDVGCGLGFETATLLSANRDVIGIDYDRRAAGAAHAGFAADGLLTACTDALDIGLRGGVFDYATSSHLIEHFRRPEAHVAELARVLRPDGTALVITPNRPADFENPFHLVLFVASELEALLKRHFHRVWVGGLDGSDRVKEDFAARRARARKVMRLDVFGLRHRLPRSWYIALYSRALPLAYRMLARDATGGSSGIAADDFFITDRVDDSTLVLFAECSHPRR